LRKVDANQWADVGSLYRSAALLAAGALVGFAACATVLQGRSRLRRFVASEGRLPVESLRENPLVIARRELRFLSRG
jgi:hypothetical protein